MIIRPADEKDIEAMARLTRDALSFASSPDPYTWEDSTDAELTKRLRAYIHPKTGFALIVQVEETIAGFVAAHFDELDPKHPDKGAIIDLLAVDPEHRGLGLGTHLVTELIQVLPEQKVTRVQVDVISKNGDAVRFWRRAGFQDIAVTMGRELASAASAAVEEKE
jgi:ribosomal protein S18 acetylase RimI-like enzyme